MLAIPIVALLIVIACYVFVPRKLDLRPSKASWAWSIAFLAPLAFLTVYGAMNLVDAEAPIWILVSAVLAACSITSLWHERIKEFLGGLTKPLPYIIEGALLILCAYFTFVAIELPSNQEMMSFWWEGLVLEVVIIFLAMVSAHFLFQRTGAGASLVALIFEFMGIAEYFVVEFKNVPIMASDVLALGTAAAVGGGYTYLLKSSVLVSLSVLAPTILALSLTPKFEIQRRRKAVAVNLAASVVVSAGLILGCVNIDFAKTFGVTYNAWLPLTSYWREGFVTSFITQLQSFRPEKPNGYSNESADELIASYAATYDATLGATQEHADATAQFEKERPSVVVIMNESFADLSVYDQLQGTYTGPAWFNSFEGALAKGTLYVSPYGGGTCNSEWEFLTGGSMAFMGSGVYPYMVYDMAGVQNLAATFKGLGYSTYAMHPNLATNWYRNVVYPALGFDDFLDITDFTGASRLRNMVTDEATYDKTLELLEKDDNPQFIFNVTMQNHGGYLTGALPSEMVSKHVINGTDYVDLDEYLALIDESDRALQAFVEKLEQLDRKVVVVFFGDHQPSLGAYYNNVLVQDDDPLTHEERTRTTDYMIYANYDIPGTTTGTVTPTSTNFLGADMMQLIGAPLDDFLKAQLVMRNTDMPLLNLLGYTDAEGTWYDISPKVSKGATTGAPALRNDLQTLQYRQFFYDGVHYQTGSGYSGTVWGRMAQTDPTV